MRRINHIWLDFSSIQAYSRCKRKFFLSLVQGLEPVAFGDGSLAASFRGTLIHAALDAFQRKISWEPVVEALIPEDAALRDILESRSGSLKHIKALIAEYVKQYEADGIEYLVSEQTLQMPLTNRITLQGTVDNIVKDPSGIAVMDHKTSSSLRQYVEPSIALSDQFTGYIALANANGFETNRLVVDGISTALKALNDREGLFVRYETERTVEQIESYKFRMEVLGEEIIDFIEHNEVFQENISLPTPACNEFGSKCVFLDACTSGNSGRNIINSSFRKTLTPWKNFRIVFDEGSR